MLSILFTAMLSLSLTCKVESEQFSKNSRSDIICVSLREREYSDGSQIVVNFSSDKHLFKYILGICALL